MPYERKVTTDTHGQDLPCTIWMDRNIVNTLEYLEEQIIADKYDVVSLIFGEEGTGKSTLAFQLALLMDANFGIDNIVFTPEQFTRAVSTLPKGSAIVWDESEDLADHHASQTIKTLKDFMQKMRQQRKKVFLVKPEMKDIKWYFVKRARWGGFEPYDKPYAKRGEKRGYCNYYSAEQLRKYRNDAKKKSSDYSTLEFRFGDYTGEPGFPVDMSPDGEYELKKESSYATTGLMSREESVIYSCLVYIQENRLKNKAFKLGSEELEVFDQTYNTFSKTIREYIKKREE